MTHTATGGTATDQARDKAQEVGAQAKEKAQEAGAQARSRVRDEVDRRSTQAGDQAGSAAQALRDASQRLRDDGNDPVARGFEQVADRVERAGGWLRDSDGDSILRDVEDFGRRNSLAVVAGGLALGFAASRLLKASSRRRYEAGGSSVSRPQSTNGASGYTPPVTAPPPADPAVVPRSPADPAVVPRSPADPTVAPRSADPVVGADPVGGHDPATLPPREPEPPLGRPDTPRRP